MRSEKSKMAAKMAVDFLEMAVYIKLVTTTCFYLGFGLKMIILEENRYK